MSTTTDAPPDYAPELEPPDVLDALAAGRDLPLPVPCHDTPSLFDQEPADR